MHAEVDVDAVVIGISMDALVVVCPVVGLDDIGDA